MTAIVLRGDARALPLPDGCVDLIVTSPPFYQLRSYTDGGQHYEDQIGSEATVGEFLENLWQVTAECARVLKPEGSIFIELGDSYATRYSSVRGGGRAGLNHDDGSRGRSGQNRTGTPEKSLLLTPHRYAIGCIDRLGLTLRAEIVWHHVNGLPESVTDRCRRSHSVAFHFTRQPRYYAAVDEIREPHTSGDHDRSWAKHLAGQRQSGTTVNGNGETARGGGRHSVGFSPLGKLPGSVWDIASQPLQVPARLGVDHFACVDAETEILTRRGWLHHDEISIGDEVAGCDLDTGLTSWTRCHGVHRYDYDGEIVTAEARGLSMRLTPNHRTLVHAHRGRHALRSPVEVIDASDLTKNHAVPRAVEWADDGREKSIGADLAALCGWVAAEGWYQNGRGVHLSQSAGVNRDHVAAIDALLDRLGTGGQVTGRNVYPSREKWRARIGYQGKSYDLGTYERREDAENAAHEFRAARGLDLTYRTEAERCWRGRKWIDVSWRLAYGLGAEVRRIMPDKLLPAWLADLPLAEIRALLDAFVDGDGHRRADGRMSVFQQARHNLDVLQAAAVRLGYNTTLRPGGGRWVLYLNPPRPARLRRSDGTSLVGREHCRGVVWCVTTGTGTFVARRNGSVFVTGNSFPSELPRRIIAGWSPPGICVACGQGRRPVTSSTKLTSRPGLTVKRRGQPLMDNGGNQSREGRAGDYDTTITGYACACTPYTGHPGTGESSGTSHSAAVAAGSYVQTDYSTELWHRPKTGPWREYHLERWTPPPTRPAIVVDPFGGTGTTALVASVLGRVGVSVDRSADYCRLAAWRTADPGERCRVIGAPKPPPVADGQDALFALDAAMGP